MKVGVEQGESDGNPVHGVEQGEPYEPFEPYELCEPYEHNEPYGPLRHESDKPNLHSRERKEGRKRGPSGKPLSLGPYCNRH